MFKFLTEYIFKPILAVICGLCCIIMIPFLIAGILLAYVIWVVFIDNDDEELFIDVPYKVEIIDDENSKNN